METITISLTPERLEHLKRVAEQLQVSPEELARATVEDMLALPDDTFRASAERVLKANAELYRRLA
jgi:acyl-CoA reductase-like NAD-dependent aldehyde dehydrogenase